MKQQYDLKKIVGTRQVFRELQNDNVVSVLLAEDAEKNFLAEIIEECDRRGITINWYDSMKKLGDACGIEVKAASAAILKN